MFNLSETALLIIFQYQLVVVVAPKAWNFGNQSELKLGAVGICGGPQRHDQTPPH